MKKTIIAILISLVVFLAIGGIWAYYICKTSNPWNAHTIGEIPAPFGYHRVEAPAGSYAEYLRNLPLKEKGAKIMLYTGGQANFQFLGTGVIDRPLLSNYEQCADVTMRLRAEYLWKKGRYSQAMSSSTLRVMAGNTDMPSSLPMWQGASRVKLPSCAWRATLLPVTNT